MLVSHPSEDGSVVFAIFPPGVRLEVLFFDEEAPRDITRLAPDLLLLGLSAFAAASGTGAPEVQVGEVRVTGGSPSVFFLHPAAQLCRSVSDDELVAMVGAGVASQVTAGVAYEREHGASDAGPSGAR